MKGPEFTLSFDLGNAEFDGEVERQLGIARVLIDTAGRVQRGETIGTLFDVNGNKVGGWSFDECEEEDDQ
ncbi:MAG: hypothetical protein WKF79_00140 [Nocardioides sp.]